MTTDQWGCERSEGIVDTGWIYQTANMVYADWMDFPVVQAAFTFNYLCLGYTLNAALEAKDELNF